MAARPGLVLIDTNIISKALRGIDGVRERWSSHPAHVYRISSMVLAELEYAAMRAEQPQRHRLKWQTLTAGMPILPFDGAAAGHHARIREALRHQPIVERDLVIAATALAHDCTVVTNNRREFDRVPGLSVEDWTE